MFRVAMSIAFAAAVGLTALHAVPSTADAKKASSKRCLATDSAGKKVSFKCASDEKCCWQPILNKGACVKAPGICL